ncbi:PAAR domain-containing protein [Paraburkholderia rhizosphaerae]|uniref:PAAR motif-containing protein n=1 Tax=Paraburkholderia rhizosphaerae TaxID=480658 RepID=A0A4R8LX92_9BURK|nr:PAAR domain-containing protein [Paraburkholderia rhizosphaerae]TDY51812.1 PAAR motif-containing protein [Paraburkholderia rhizosphaerae]
MSEQRQRKGAFYPFATIGARTERGGRVTSGAGVKVCGLPVACVGHIVTYNDASEAVIADGAGGTAVIDDRSAAVVGSVLDKSVAISDIPRREPHTSTIFMPVDEHGFALTRQ